MVFQREARMWMVIMVYYSQRTCLDTSGSSNASVVFYGSIPW